MSNLMVVTASTKPTETQQFWQTWFDNKTRVETGVFMLVNGLNRYEQMKKISALSSGGNGPILATAQDYGVVPNFYKGVKEVVDNLPGIKYILCLHDDVALNVQGWDEAILDWLKEHPDSLFGFGGAHTLGRLGMYDGEYDPYSLARHGFMSNMVGAESHGVRETRPRRVAVLDGFSIGGPASTMLRMFTDIMKLGILHHAYDAAAGAWAARHKKETWMLPIPCHHAGGRTAVADQDYNEWAMRVREKGDQSFWEEAHHAVWEEFKDVLPISVVW